MTSGEINPYQELANAIIKQAADDYRKELMKLKKNPSDNDSRAKAAKIEDFFRSKWYSVLTSLDGESLIGMLKDQVGVE
ncbi:MAG: hypothetical protein K5989_12545 [Lachnospiraceae bacterium]|nr:hypothetical protein [Lachnospiraceae bacterium]